MNIELLHTIFLAHPEVTTDSRNCPRGSMFFALKGDKFDGNLYAKMALDNGCAYAVVDNKEIIPSDDNRYILVHDVLATLQQLAKFHRNTFSIPVIQITGTNGKTTTKELLSAVLSKKYNTLFTQGNLNNHIGVPRTLLRLCPEHEIAVIETGANHPGEIAFLCDMVQADCGLITNVGRAHLEGFGSFEGVKSTKGELYDDLISRECFAFLNTKDANLANMASERNLKTIPYVQGEVTECNPMLQVRWYCETDGEWHTAQTNLIGSYNLANVLSAITVGLHFGLEPALIDKALKEYIPTNNRSEFRNTGRNRLIIDAYNANPTSMAAALENFRQMQAENKMVILGEMRELGKDSTTEHQNIINILDNVNASEIWLVGQEFQYTNRSLLTTANRVFSNVDEVKQELSNLPLKDKMILIKGSNGTRLFELPDYL
ncbi:MAG: UDP-N-acetylmuramoyl-tripeptide--D-alanyl-D-alanine ligase [Bacteroidaceae bacterium]|nr:UDP-N-acetylmuramoyl-tripeptide--D-alanyl-D-alanine ligase [Bacteroidaceae bacterium]